jgi:hypothetical protein|tara:strand:+ start:630 stop:773 length:144 start_codon:yes stop_codon:yes gene_type:complete
MAHEISDYGALLWHKGRSPGEGIPRSWDAKATSIERALTDLEVERVQ